jgi:hypothetical protein
VKPLSPIYQELERILQRALEPRDPFANLTFTTQPGCESGSNPEFPAPLAPSGDRLDLLCRFEDARI